MRYFRSQYWGSQYWGSQYWGSSVTVDSGPFFGLGLSSLIQNTGAYPSVIEVIASYGSNVTGTLGGVSVIIHDIVTLASYVTDTKVIIGELSPTDASIGSIQTTDAVISELTTTLAVVSEIKDTKGA